MRLLLLLLSVGSASGSNTGRGRIDGLVRSGPPTLQWLPIIDDVIRLDPNDARVLGFKASVLGVIGAPPADVLAAVDHALAVEHTLPIVHQNRGAALQQMATAALNGDHSTAQRAVAMRRMREALTSYDFAIAIKPTTDRAHFNRGLSIQQLFDHGAWADHREALACFDAALALLPNDDTASVRAGVDACCCLPRRRIQCCCLERPPRRPARWKGTR